MSFQGSLSLPSMSATCAFVFFSFTLFFSFFSFLLFITRMKPWCNCLLCKSYLTLSWARKFTNLCDWYTHLLRKSPSGTIHMHVLGNTITSNPDNVEYILKTNFHNYPKGKPFSAILGDLLGKGIFNVDGDSWRFQRKMASLELGSVAIRSYAMELVNEEIHSRLLPIAVSTARGEMNKEKVLDLQDILRRFSFDNICKISFGLDPGCLLPSLPVSDLADAFDLASKLSAERAMTSSPCVWRAKRLLGIGSEKRLKEAIKVVNDVADGMIKQRREMGFNSRNDLLSRFMGSVDDDAYLRDIVVSFLLAGRDTIASALTGFFSLLSKSPEVEARIREEVGPGPEPPTFEQIREMHYLNGAVHESMRLFPPIQFDSKFAKEDDVLPDGTFVRKGSRVTYHPYAMGRMENIWGPDCLQFRPERWLRDGVFVPPCPFKYPVFQAGVRVCLGKDLALTEMKSVVVALIRRFDIRVVEPDQELRFTPGLTATLRGGLPVRVFERAAVLSQRATLSLLRATSHDSFTPPTSKHLSTLLTVGDGSRATASAAMDLLMDRLQSTQSSAVALKCLIAVHYVLKRGSFIMRDQLPYSGGGGGKNYLNLSKFRDRSSPVCWELSSWVRWYAKHVEQLLWASRIVGFFLGVEADQDSTQGLLGGSWMKAGEERASGLTNNELLRETKALLAVVEGIGGIPDVTSMEGNKLVSEISSLVKEDGNVTLDEVLVRINELRERFGFMSFGEMVELVYVFNRLEKCREMVTVGEKQRLLMDLVREMKEKAEKMMCNEGKTMSTHRATKSDKFEFPNFFINSVDLVRFPSARLQC